MQNVLHKTRILFVTACLINTLIYAQRPAPHARPRPIETERVIERRNENREEADIKKDNKKIELVEGGREPGAAPFKFNRKIIPYESYHSKTIKELTEEFGQEQHTILVVEDKLTNKKIEFNLRANRIIVDENVYIKSKPEYTSADIFKFCEHQYKKSDVHIASIIDETSDRPNVTELRNAAKKNNVSYSLLDKEHLESTFKAAQHGLLIITSHYEQKELFARSSDKQPITNKLFTENELNALAKKHKVQLIYLGCETEKIGEYIGLGMEVEDQAVVQSIDKVMEHFGHNEFIERSELFKTMLPENNTIVVSTFDLNEETAVIKVDLKENKTEHHSSHSDSTSSGTLNAGETNQDSKEDNTTIVFIGLAAAGIGGYTIYNWKKQKNKTT